MTPFTCPEPYVKVQLVLSQRKWKKRKTSARKGMATPYFNKTVTFLVPFSQIDLPMFRPLVKEGAIVQFQPWLVKHGVKQRPRARTPVGLAETFIWSDARL